MHLKKINNAKDITVTSEELMSGLRLVVDLKKAGVDGYVDVYDYMTKTKLEVSLNSNNEQITIIPKRPIIETSTASNYGDNAFNLVRYQTGENYLFIDILWSGNAGNAMVNMYPNSRYTINLYQTHTVRSVNVNAIKDDTVGEHIQKYSTVIVDAGEHRTIDTATEDGRIIGLTVPVVLDVDANDFELLLSFANGNDMPLTWVELMQLSIVQDNEGMQIFEDDGIISEQMKNHMVFINLLAFSSHVTKVKVINNNYDRLELLTNKITTL